MHELSITQSLLDIALEQARTHGATRVSKIRVVAGAMHNLVDDSMRFCFEILSRGTAAEGADLTVETVPATARCRGCQERFELQPYDWRCPKCQSREFDLVAGNELLVSEIEME